MKKNADGTLTLTATEVAALELIVGEWEEEAEATLKENGEPTAIQDAFIVDFVKVTVARPFFGTGE